MQNWSGDQRQLNLSIKWLALRAFLRIYLEVISSDSTLGPSAQYDGMD